MEPPHIVSSINLDLLDKEFLSVSDRYYEHKYCTQFSTNEKNLDQRISFHTNRICMISLAENHPVIKNTKSITKINCLIDNKTDRRLNNTTGKGKRGAQKLNPNSVLCFIDCDDGTTYPIYSCVKGKLLEINENLLNNPNLILEKPISEGYIALVLPILNLYNDLKNSMISKDKYLAQMKEAIKVE